MNVSILYSDYRHVSAKYFAVFGATSERIQPFATLKMTT